MCWGLGAHRGGRAQGGGLDTRSCGHTWALPAQRMFMKHLPWARLDQRLSTRVSEAQPILEKLVVERRVARDLSISTSVGRVHRGEGRCPGAGTEDRGQAGHQV